LIRTGTGSSRSSPSGTSFQPLARKHFLLDAPSHAQSVSESGYGSELEFILRSGLVVRSSPNRVKPAPERIEFRRVMAQLAKFPLFDTQDVDVLLVAYRSKHFTYEEDTAEQSADRQRHVSSRDWVESFLNAASPAQWEKPYQQVLYEPTRAYTSWFREVKRAKDQPPPEFRLPEVAEAAKLLVRHALSSPAPTLLSAGATVLPEALRPIWPRLLRRVCAIACCIRPCAIQLWKPCSGSI